MAVKVIVSERDRESIGARWHVRVSGGSNLELLLLRDLCAEELVVENLELELHSIAASLTRETDQRKLNSRGKPASRAQVRPGGIGACPKGVTRALC